MSRLPPTVRGACCALALSAWSLAARAQPSEPPAASPEPPAAPTPPVTPEPTPPPTDPAPPAEAAPVSPAPSGAEPAPAPPMKAPAPTPPAAAEFPSPSAPVVPAAPPAATAPEAVGRAPASSPGRPEDARPALVTPAPAAQAYLEDRDPDKDETDHFKIGPLIGSGVPSLFSFGGTLKLTRFLGAGVNVGLIPTMQLSYYGDATLSYQHYDIYGRIYPLGGGFFLGAGAGYATVEGTLKRTFDTSASPQLPASVAYESRGTVRTLMLTALIGYLHTFQSGLSLGLDGGAQIPIAPSQVDFESSVAGNYPQPLLDKYLTPADKSVKDSLEKIGRTILPTVNVRIGWIL